MLSPWVSWCSVEDHVIFLDVRRNRYVALPRAAGEAVVTGHVDLLSEQLRARLTGWDWIDQTVGNRIDELPPRSRSEFSALSRAVRPDFGVVFEAAAILVLTSRKLRTQTFERCLEHIAESNLAAGRRGEKAPMDMIVTAFEYVERFFVGRDKCLVRSLALHELLARHGHRSSLVFGVRLHPFQAHCWLQKDETLLNDTIEITGMFQPLRAVS